MPLALPAVAVGLSLILTWLVLYGMHHGSNTWLRTLLEEYSKPRGSFIHRAVTAPIRLITRGVLRVERWVRAAIASALLASELAVVGWLHALAVLAHGLAHEIAELGEGIEAGIRDLTLRWIPRYVNKALSPVAWLARDAWRLGHRVDRYAHAQARRLARGIDTLRRDLRRDIVRARRGIEAGIAAHVLPRIHSLERRLGRVLTRDLPRIRARERALERTVANPSKAWLRRIGAALWATTIFGLLVKFLVRRFPWLFCRNVDRLGRAVCGLPPETMSALLATLLGTLALSDLRSLVRTMQDVEHAVAQEVIDLLQAFD